MARKKVKLQFIENDTARKVTYKKRVRGLLKKTQELSILCDVNACAIVYGQYSEAPEIWPSMDGEVRRVVTEYRQKLDIDQSQRKLTQEDFLKQSLTKSEEKFQRLQRRNRELAMENVMCDLLCGEPVERVVYGDVGDLIWVIEDRLRTYQHRLGVLEGPNANAPANPNIDLN
ncbi:hypothetical protein RND81_05G148800 [Saponaria officinalis]|uniref:MADS-box domain-containing protein n=1 Tax=Saponaria officinalis TaxID=3572 RepID=A0AAW1KYQ5_SAPOF